MLDARVERFRAGATIDEMRWLSDRLEQLADEADDGFPLSEDESVELLADLAARLRDIVAAEQAALDELEAAIGGLGRTRGRPAAAARYHRAMTRPLKVGVQLPEVEREVRWPELLDMARAIEDLGYDSVWFGEHLLYRWPDRAPRGPWEAWAMLAAVAAVTSRIELGPLVACTAFHNPAVLAKRADTIDEISGGRFILGLGAGWNETEFRAFGIPFDHRIARFEEAFTIIRGLLQRRRDRLRRARTTRPATASCCRAGRGRAARRS